MKKTLSIYNEKALYIIVENNCGNSVKAAGNTGSHDEFETRCAAVSSSNGWTNLDLTIELNKIGWGVSILVEYFYCGTQTNTIGIIHLLLKQNLPKNQHFLPPDTHTYMCVSRGKKY